MLCTVAKTAKSFRSQVNIYGVVARVHPYSRLTTEVRAHEANVKKTMRVVAVYAIAVV